MFAACSTGGGSSTFIGLTDVPSAFVNSSFLRSTASALQFRTPSQVRSDIGADNASNLASGTVADARISATIARYAELPSTNELVPTTGTTGHVLTKTATGRNWAAGGGGGDLTGIDAGTGIRIDDPTTTTPEVNIANSANLPGNPTTTTQTTGNNSTRIATTAFVLSNAGGGITGIDAGDGIRIDDGATSTPEVNIDDDSVTEDMIADDAVGVAQLKTGSGTATIGAINQFVAVPQFSFSPRIYRTTSSVGECYIDIIYDNSDQATTTKWRVRVASGTGCVMEWDYVASSDNPSVWVVTKDSDGSVESVWESEDPASPGDTVAPISDPVDADNNPLPGYTAVNVGLPTFSVVEQVYAAAPLDGSARDLTAAQRTAAVTASSDYFLARGWIASPIVNIVDPATMAPERYRPSVLQWYMRFAAPGQGRGRDELLHGKSGGHGRFVGASNAVGFVLCSQAATGTTRSRGWGSPQPAATPTAGPLRSGQSDKAIRDLLSDPDTRYVDQQGHGRSRHHAGPLRDRGRRASKCVTKEKSNHGDRPSRPASSGPRPS